MKLCRRLRIVPASEEPHNFHWRRDGFCDIARLARALARANSCGDRAGRHPGPAADRNLDRIRMKTRCR